jgi:hypothetical protein
MLQIELLAVPHPGEHVLTYLGFVEPLGNPSLSGLTRCSPDHIY